MNYLCTTTTIPSKFLFHRFKNSPRILFFIQCLNVCTTVCICIISLRTNSFIFVVVLFKLIQQSQKCFTFNIMTFQKFCFDSIIRLEKFSHSWDEQIFLFQVPDDIDVKLVSYSFLQGFSFSKVSMQTTLLFVCAQECE